MTRATIVFFLLLTAPSFADGPSPAAALIAQGRQDAANGLPLLALADWAKAATLDPVNPDVYDIRAQFHAGRAEWDAAERDAAKAVQMSPTYDRREFLGDTLVNLGKHREAARAYAAALLLSLEIGNKTAADWLTDGQNREQAGQPEQAAACYEAALRRDPKNVDALHRHQSLLLAWGDGDGALADANALAALTPDDAQAYADRSDVLRSLGRWDGALTDAGVAIRLAPQDPAAWLARGVTYSEHAQTLTGNAAHTARQSAIDDFSHALLLDPNNVKAVSARGLAYYAQDDYDHALPDLDKAADLGAGFSVVFLFRANIHAFRHDDALAVADFTHAIQFDPADARAYAGRATALRRLGRNTEADADDAKTRSLTPSSSP